MGRAAGSNGTPMEAPTTAPPTTSAQEQAALQGLPSLPIPSPLPAPQQLGQQQQPRAEQQQLWEPEGGPSAGGTPGTIEGKRGLCGRVCVCARRAGACSTQGRLTGPPPRVQPRPPPICRAVFLGGLSLDTDEGEWDSSSS